jgi:hypothetical protein
MLAFDPVSISNDHGGEQIVVTVQKDCFGELCSRRIVKRFVRDDPDRVGSDVLNLANSCERLRPGFVLGETFLRFFVHLFGERMRVFFQIGNVARALHGIRATAASTQRECERYGHGDECQGS